MVGLLSSFLTPAALLFCLFISSVTAVATCYREDNHNATNSIYTPCNNDTPFSMCYRSQVDATGSPADHSCLPNGITQNINIAGGYEYWRQSCTDPTWQSPYCLNAFDACVSDSNSNAQINPCGNSASSLTWCCGVNNTACCGTSGAITIAAIIGPSSTSSSSSSTQATSTSTSSTSPTSSSTPPSSSNGLSTGAKAGIGIGIGAALGAFAVLGLIGWLALRRRKQKGRGMGGAAQLAGSEVYPVGELDGGKKIINEQQALYEADGQHEVGQYQDAPVEMGSYERPLVRE